MKIDKNDTQVRYVRHASRKIIINSNANYQSGTGDEKYDERQQEQGAKDLQNIVVEAIRIHNLITETMAHDDNYGNLSTSCRLMLKSLIRKSKEEKS